MSQRSIPKLLSLKSKQKFTFVEVSTLDHLSACLDADVQTILVSDRLDFAAARRLAPDAFLVARLASRTYTTQSEIRAAAFTLIQQDADAIYCPYAASRVEALTAEGIPVMGHAGAKPLRADLDEPVGTTAKDAFQLYKSIKALRSAGCFSVVLERAPAKVVETITNDFDILILGKGSGTSCDGQFLSADELLGLKTSAYVKPFRDHAAEHQKLKADAASAFREFTKGVSRSTYPGLEETIDAKDEEYETFIYALDKAKKKKA